MLFFFFSGIVSVVKVYAFNDKKNHVNFLITELALAWLTGDPNPVFSLWIQQLSRKHWQAYAEPLLLFLAG